MNKAMTVSLWAFLGSSIALVNTTLADQYRIVVWDGKKPLNSLEECRYRGSNEIEAMVGYKGGILVAFNERGRHTIRWSDASAADFAQGELRSGADFTTTTLTTFGPGIIASGTGVGANGNRAYYHADGNHLMDGTGCVYDGGSPVEAMVSYQSGVLTAFDTHGGYAIHWSADGSLLGSGPKYYDGVSPVEAMIPFRRGVAVAFSNVEGKPNWHRIHWSADGERLGEGEIFWGGGSRVTAMLPFKEGMLVAFTNWGKLGERIIFSHDGHIHMNTVTVHDGPWPILAMAQMGDKVVIAIKEDAGANTPNQLSWDGNLAEPGGPGIPKTVIKKKAGNRKKTRPSHHTGLGLQTKGTGIRGTPPALMTEVYVVNNTSQKRRGEVYVRWSAQGDMPARPTKEITKTVTVEANGGRVRIGEFPDILASYIKSQRVVE